VNQPLQGNPVSLITQRLRFTALCLCTAGLMASCDWVDSAGVQGTSPATQIAIDNELASDVIGIDEKTTATLTLARDTQSDPIPTFSFSSEPLAEGNLSLCEEISNYNAEFAADSLVQACTSIDDCQFDIEMLPIEDDAQEAAFNMTVPSLRASVGLRYELSIDNGDGVISNNERTFCLLAVNEAPDANDDTFVVAEGATLNITPSTTNLLSNDTDDIDVTNLPLEIDAEALVEPTSAEFFELGTDGSFNYQSSLSALREDQFDSFEYELTDGLFTSTATVTIRIVTANQAPQQLEEPLPLQLATQGQPFNFSLGDFFVDPEGVDVRFSLSPGTPFALGSGFRLSSDGELSGTPTSADVGSYALLILASDGSSTSTANLAIEVDAASEPVTNSAPVFVPQSVFSQRVQVDSVITPVQPLFTDEDDDTLSYSMAGNRLLPSGVFIDVTTGVISGSPRVVGNFNNLRVRATDPSGLFALSSTFSLTVLEAR